MKMWIAAMALVGGALAHAPMAMAQHAESVQIPLNISTPGDAFAYSYQMQLAVDQQIGGQAGGQVNQRQAASYDLHLAFTVRQVDAAGNTELAMRISQAKIVLTDGTDAEARTTSLAVPPQKPADPADEALMALFDVEQRLNDAVFIFLVTPQSKVMNVTGLDMIVQSIAALKTPDSRLLGPLAPGQIERLLENIFGADGAAGSARAAGEKWQSARTVDVPPIAVLEFTDDVTLDSVDENRAVISTTGSVRVRSPESDDPARPGLRVEEFSSSATTQWDMSAGRMQLRENKMTMTTTWQLAEVELHQKQRVAARIERTQ